MRLNTTRIALIRAIQPSTAVTVAGQPTAAPRTDTAKNTPATTTLEAGPAMAIQNSALGLGGSLLISATPPNRNRVMPFIGRPNRLATSEWHSS